MDDIILIPQNEKELKTLIQAVRIYRYRVEFGIEKCAMLIMRRGKQQMTEGLKQPNQEKIKTLEAKET